MKSRKLSDRVLGYGMGIAFACIGTFLYGVLIGFLNQLLDGPKLKSLDKIKTIGNDFF